MTGTLTLDSRDFRSTSGRRDAVATNCRLITGQSRDSMMAMVLNMTRITIIVTAATTMSILGSNLHNLFTTELSTDINQLFTGDNQTAAQSIDKNLANTALAMAAIQAVQAPSGDAQTVADKSRAVDLAIFGTASPPMAAGAMLLLYNFAIALFVGLGPFFILCLIFDQTKELFRRWLMYGIGTLFSMALLSAVTAIVMDLTSRVAAALWATEFINALTGNNSEGLSNQAMEQGGVGLLMTVLIISVPPMAAMFFQGTMRQFYFSSAFGHGGARQGANGQLQSPGAYGYGGHGPGQVSIRQVNAGQISGGAATLNASRPSSPGDPRLGNGIVYARGYDAVKQGGGLANPPTSRG